MKTLPVSRPRSPTSFMVYVGGIVSAAMIMFPPFSGIGGIEHAFVLSGPEWSQHLGEAARELGLEPRIHWFALGVQLGVVWAITLGALWFFSSPREDR